MSNRHTHLQQLENHYRWRRVGELALLSVGGALLIYALSKSMVNDDQYLWIPAAISGLILFLGRYRQLHLHRLNEQDIARYLNRRFETLEDSTELLIANPEVLGPLQQIQRRRIQGAFAIAAQHIEWPQQWGITLAIFITGLLTFAGVHLTGERTALESFRIATVEIDSTSSSAGGPAAELKVFDISASPPAYTGLRALHFKDFHLQVPEGSRINWRLQFSGAPTEVMMIFSSGDSMLLTRNADTFSLSRLVNQSGYYSVRWRDQGKLQSADFYKLEVVEDQPPKVTIDDQEQFLVFPWKEEIEVAVQSALSDDYGLTEAYVVATVSKGSGESVKFREERLPFARPVAFPARRAQATLELNTRSLGMEPGDELYYYVEAWDNRTPQRQSNRTETYFIQLQDTSTQMISFDGGLGVDLMPEYFRSQRQIIIDSEKLLAARSMIEQPVFNERSNNLGHDQKVLRLRYGQFLGEEFESGMAPEPQAETEAVPANEEEILEQYGHTHDADNEHNLVEEHGQDESSNPGEQQESALADFVHAHDSEEEATFFIQSVKVKLRAALSMMWDAELHLRMNDPAQSLPYQYKILQLLKEISNDSRIYVHRTGFDAPPLKEEKRLTGDLDEVNSSRISYISSGQQPYSAIRRALPLLEQLLENLPVSMESSTQEILLAAGHELAKAAIEQPDAAYLAGLSALRSILDGQINEQNLRQVREVCWRLLPPLPRAAAGDRNAAHGLQDAFIQQLKAQSNR